MFLVVGPSGGGKDTLIDGARTKLSQGSNWLFPQRIIDRPADQDSEPHQSVTTAEFEQRAKEGAFALHWAAHGHHYALPGHIDTALAQGKNVVVNVSRSVIDDARSKYQPVRVIVVTAPASILAERLAARGRETKSEIDERLQRALEPVPDGPRDGSPNGFDVTAVVNDGTIEAGVQRFVKALMAD